MDTNKQESWFASFNYGSPQITPNARMERNDEVSGSYTKYGPRRVTWRLAGGANHRRSGTNGFKPRKGRSRLDAYAINTSEPALSHCFWNEKSPTYNPARLARSPARVTRRDHSNGEWNRRECGRRFRSCASACRASRNTLLG